MMINLSEVITGFEGTLVQDGTFETIALSSYKGEKKFLAFGMAVRYLDEILSNPATGCLICSEEVAQALPEGHGYGVFVTAEPKLVWTKIHNGLKSDPRYARPNAPTVVGKDCSISPLAYIDKENVVIGDHVTIEEFVSIKGHVTIGDGSIIRASAVVGGKGFNYAKDSNNVGLAIEDLGGIRIGERVEVGALSHISAATFPWEDTILEDDVKIAALTSIEHACRLGARTMLATCACMGGLVDIGTDAWFGLNATAKNIMTVGNHARINMGATATQNVPDHTAVSGNFAIEHEKFLKNLKASLK